MDWFEPNTVTCSTIQSAHRIQDQIAAARCLIVDECHEFSSTNSVKVLKQFKNTVYDWLFLLLSVIHVNASYRLGFSATPWRVDDDVHNYRLKGWFGPQLCDLTTSTLQARNILSQSRVHFYPLSYPQDLKDVSYIEAEQVRCHCVGVCCMNSDTLLTERYL